jgi:ABC-type nitrate/sulfonate/bicarbonate transport system substrate-binding protein
MRRIAVLMFLWMLIGAPISISAAPINFSTASDSGNTAPLWVAKDAGFLEKYGNATQLIFIPGAGLSISALLNEAPSLLSPHRRHKRGDL